MQHSSCPPPPIPGLPYILGRQDKQTQARACCMPDVVEERGEDGKQRHGYQGDLPLSANQHLNCPQRQPTLRAGKGRPGSQVASIEKLWLLTVQTRLTSFQLISNWNLISSTLTDVIPLL